MRTDSSEEEPGSSAWVVEAWRQRGLISGDAVISKEELAEFHTANSNSWFARRNRKSPHCHASCAIDESAGWLARRNRKPRGACPENNGFSLFLPDTNGQQPGALEAWLRGRLLSTSSRKLPSVKARSRHISTISPGTSRDELNSSAESLATPGVPVHRLEPLEDGTTQRPHVELTMYDLCTCCPGIAHRLGIGVYHSGIVIEARVPSLSRTTAPHMPQAPLPTLVRTTAHTCAHRYLTAFRTARVPRRRASSIPTTTLLSQARRRPMTRA